MVNKIQFTEKQLKKIESRYKAGEMPVDIAKSFNCSRDVIRSRLVELKVSLRKVADNKKCIRCDVFLEASNTTWYKQKNYIYKCNECTKTEKAIEAQERRKNDPVREWHRARKYKDNQKATNPKLYTAQQMQSSARKRSTALDLPFNITSKYIESICVDKCAILGVELKYGGGVKTIQSASLDKIIPEKGYVKGNVEVISNLANTMKNEATPEQLILFADWIYDNFKLTEIK
jgi:hypothetical protein